MIERKTLAKDLGCDVLGSALFGVGMYIFASGAEFAPSGVTGLSLILHHLFGVPLGIASVLLNVPIVLISCRVVGRSFMLKSIKTILILSAMLDIIFPLFPVYTGNRLLAAFFTGLFVGIGSGVVFGRGSSTGGTDFLVMTIKHFAPQMSLGSINLMLNAAVIGLGGVVFGNIDAVLLGIVSSITGSVMLDKMMIAAQSRQVVVVITRQKQQVASAIQDGIQRGTTILDARGGYTGEESGTILCACTRAQSYTVRQIVYRLDPQAFVMLLEANAVLGNGFQAPESWS